MGIPHLEIHHFKSIRELRIPCRRINLFIGPPNAGKSNLLEALGVFSLPYTIGRLQETVRCENPTNLFYDNDLDHVVKTIAGEYVWELGFKQSIEYYPFYLNIRSPAISLLFNYNFDNTFQVEPKHYEPPFRFYRFRPLNQFPRREPAFLCPVAGENLMHVLLIHKRLRQQVASLLQAYGLRLVVKPQESKIEVQKESDGIIIAYPYTVISDTLQRLIFHLAAIESNENAILILEEPEAHAFPYHTKLLAERIARDSSNQYFISTHNPYFLLPILEKAPRQDVAVFLTYWRDAQTRVRMLEEGEIEELMDLGSGLFFNLERFLEVN